MKTFLEWYNSLTEPTQNYVKTFYWVDLNTKDGYKQTDLVLDKRCCVMAQHIVENIDKDSNYLRNDFSKLLELAGLKALELDKNEYFKLLVKVFNDLSSGQFSQFLQYLPLELARKIVRTSRNNAYDSEPKPKFELIDLLFLTEDFDNINFDWLYLSRTIGAAEREIIGQERSIQVLKNNVYSFELNCDSEDKNDDTFDTLFFGEDGWTEDQKKNLLHKYNLNIDKDLDDYLERIISVDKHYLRYLKEIGDKAAFGKIYREKKSEDDPTYSKKNPYKYSTEIRQVAWAARCCYLGQFKRSDAARLGKLAALIKLYGFEFKKIIDMLYPQDNQLNEQAIEA